MYDKLIEKLRDDSILENCEFDFAHKYMHEAADAIEELQSIIQQLQNTHDDLIDFLSFLFNHIPPNEMEHYWTMFHCLDVPMCGESEDE